jgi:hypothetical protein
MNNLQNEQAAMRARHEAERENLLHDAFVAISRWSAG